MRFLLIFAVLLFNVSFAAVSKSNQLKFSESLNKAGLRNYWSQDISLWVENPGGLTKLDMEKIGYSLCGYNQGFFVVTFWQSLDGPNGKITSVTCR